MQKIRILLLVFLWTGYGPLAGPRPPFSTMLKHAEIVVLGIVESTRPVLDRYTVQGQPAHLCELSIRARRVLKGTGSGLAGTVIKTVSPMTSSSCVPDSDSRLLVPTGLALWLIGQDHEGTTIEAPHVLAAYAVGALAPRDEQHLEEWQDATTVSMYLMLKPGLTIQRTEYASSSLPIQMVDLAGWRRFLEIYSLVYRESDEDDRKQISLVASSFGHCLISARRAAEEQGGLLVWLQREPLLDVGFAKESDEAKARRMGWANRTDLLKAFANSEEAVEELTFRACSSGQMVRMRARNLLSAYFGTDLSTLPCIPCE